MYMMQLRRLGLLSSPYSPLCELVELPRASFYGWAKPVLSDRYLDDAYLSNEVFDIWERSRRTYGSPRVWGQLRRSGTRISRKRVARLMAECSLVGTHARKRWRRGRANTAPASASRRRRTLGTPDRGWRLKHAFSSPCDTSTELLITSNRC